MSKALVASICLHGLMIGALAVPLPWAWRANRATSLRHAVLWGAAACAAWLFAFSNESAAPLAPFLALSLTGGAGVAVLGARRPYVGAWNFVVIGLLAVMLVPLAESLVLGKDLNEPLRVFFLGATIAVSALNYLPTRAGPGAILVAVGCAGQMLALFWPDLVRGETILALMLALPLAPWVVFVAWLLPRPSRSSFDEHWLDFRDRFGLFWSQRVREQFNNAAAHANWPVILGWRGLRRRDQEPITAGQEKEMMEALQALLTRFMSF